MCKRLTVLEWEAVIRRLDAQWRHVEIARELELAVSTVARIADDRRQGRYSPLDANGELGEWQPGEEELPEDDAPPGYIARNLRRCPGCGGMVYLWPCLACRMALAECLPTEPEVEEEEEEDLLEELMGLEEVE